MFCELLFNNLNTSEFIDILDDGIIPSYETKIWFSTQIIIMIDIIIIRNRNTTVIDTMCTKL